MKSKNNFKQEKKTKKKRKNQNFYFQLVTFAIDNAFAFIFFKCLMYLSIFIVCRVYLSLFNILVFFLLIYLQTSILSVLLKTRFNNLTFLPYK